MIIARTLTYFLLYRILKIGFARIISHYQSLSVTVIEFPRNGRFPFYIQKFYLCKPDGKLYSQILVLEKLKFTFSSSNLLFVRYFSNVTRISSHHQNLLPNNWPVCNIFCFSSFPLMILLKILCWSRIHLFVCGFSYHESKNFLCPDFCSFLHWCHENQLRPSLS